MAFGHITYNQSSVYGALVKNGAVRLEEAIQDLIEVHATLQSMIDGDGSNATHFAHMVTLGIVPDNANGKLLFDELSSALGKLTVDSSVSSVNSALKQFVARVR